MSEKLSYELIDCTSWGLVVDWRRSFQFCFTFAVRLLLGSISVSVTIELFDRFTTECERLVVLIREILISTVGHCELQRWFLEIVIVVVEISRRIEVDVRV
ncbi:hypothetical protein WR25_10613 [Diploscapter pachys]|uniref:Uncharacterized protein n=1 Tax=Diploscapter pachys TaxID=2018661 RepID=A0A2A2JFD4_9BILA|nr:hypothetical protein WR25_10613 [Diploscapter pachys]